MINIFSIKNNISPHIIVMLFFILCLQSPFFAQSDTEKTLQNIIIIGNKVTKDNVILRELVIHKGDVPTQDLIQESQQRLMNLFLFNRVKMDIYPHDEKSVILIIEVTEKLYFYPVPILTIRERDWQIIRY